MPGPNDTLSSNRGYKMIDFTSRGQDVEVKLSSIKSSRGGGFRENEPITPALAVSRPPMKKAEIPILFHFNCIFRVLVTSIRQPIPCLFVLRNCFCGKRKSLCVLTFKGEATHLHDYVRHWSGNGVLDSGRPQVTRSTCTLQHTIVHLYRKVHPQSGYHNPKTQEIVSFNDLYQEKIKN